MGRSRHLMFMCPFYTTDNVTTVTGECGKIKFPTHDGCEDFIKNYCAGEYDAWKQCPIAKAWIEYYNKENKLHEKKT